MNRVPGAAYGEVTGITQTIRNFGSALGLAILGSILITQNRGNIESSLGGSESRRRRRTRSPRR